jgi:predicted Rossmann fold nucleotide-binding protein DprA/Smf involved in DNA uptake
MHLKEKIMKLAIIGSRNLNVENIGDYIPSGVTEIVSGGAKGIDTLAAQYARGKGIVLTEFLPDYARYGKGAPIVRNKQIAEYADAVLAFWDGKSKGTADSIRRFRKLGKPIKVVLITAEK